MSYHKASTPLRVLVVENDGFLAEELSQILAGFGHEVAGIASTVEGALALAEETEIDIAVVDLELNAGGFGGDVAELLLRRQGVRSIILSGHLSDINREAVASLEVAGIVRKPCDPMTLRALLSRATRRQDGRSEDGTGGEDDKSAA